jgi:hypothetical protein
MDTGLPRAAPYVQNRPLYQKLLTVSEDEDAAGRRLPTPHTQASQPPLTAGTVFIFLSCSAIALMSNTTSAFNIMSDQFQNDTGTSLVFVSVFTGIGVAGLQFVFFAGRILDNFGPIVLHLISFVCVCGGYSLLAITSNPVLLLLEIALVSLGSGGTFLTALSTAISIGHPLGVAVVSMCMSVSISLTVAVTNRYKDESGCTEDYCWQNYMNLLCIATACFFFVGTFGLWHFRRLRREEEQRLEAEIQAVIAAAHNTAATPAIFMPGHSEDRMIMRQEDESLYGSYDPTQFTHVGSATRLTASSTAPTPTVRVANINQHRRSINDGSPTARNDELAALVAASTSVSDDDHMKNNLHDNRANRPADHDDDKDSTDGETLFLSAVAPIRGSASASGSAETSPSLDSIRETHGAEHTGPRQTQKTHSPLLTDAEQSYDNSSPASITGSPRRVYRSPSTRNNRSQITTVSWDSPKPTMRRSQSDPASAPGSGGKPWRLTPSQNTSVAPSPARPETPSLVSISASGSPMYAPLTRSSSVGLIRPTSMRKKPKSFKQSLELFRSRFFWSMFYTNLVGYGSSIFVVTQCAQLWDGINDDPELKNWNQNITTQFSYITAITNVVGPFLSDWLHNRGTMRRKTYLAIVCAIQASTVVSIGILAISGDRSMAAKHAYVWLMSLMGLGFGTYLTILPKILSVSYSIEDFGTFLGYLQMGSATFSVAIPTLTTGMLKLAGSYNPMYFVLGGLLYVGCAVTLSVPSKVADQHSGMEEEWTNALLHQENSNAPLLNKPSLSPQGQKHSSRYGSRRTSPQDYGSTADDA